MSFMRADGIEILQEKYRRGEVDRRLFLKLLGVLGATSLAPTGLAWAQDKTITLATWGGDTTKAIEEVLGGAFKQASGITPRSDTAGPSEGAVQAQAASGKISWDVLQLEYFSSITLGKKGFLGQIDYDVVKKEKVFEGGTHEWGVATFMSAYVLVYDKRLFGDNPPKSWADFFDVEKFPGKRTIPKWMIGMPEAALLADGVAKDQLYPLDLDRAFAKIKTLMPHVSAVWGSFSEGQQIMIDGDAAMGMLPITRAVLVDRETDKNVTYAFDDGLMFVDAWSFMKDNPAGAEAANQFIATTQDPALQVELLRRVGFAPVNPEASALVPDDLKPIDCSQPDHLKVMHTIDMNWYADNYGAALDQYTALVAG